MTIETFAWDVVDHLDTDDRIAAYLEAVFEDGDPALVASAIGDVARARGLAELPDFARATADAPPPRDGIAAIHSVVSALRALGFRLSPRPL